MTPQDPIHQDEQDHKWYFWDETWADRCGPYEMEEIAREKLKEYGYWLTHGTRPVIQNVEVAPVTVSLRFSSVEHLQAVVEAMTYFIGLPLPPEVTNSKIHSQSHATLETIKDTYEECLTAHLGVNRGLALGPQFGSGGFVTSEPTAAPKGASDPENA